MEKQKDKYLEETKLLDYSSKIIQDLIQKREWMELSDKEKIKNVYNFVRDEIPFGYNIEDTIPASQVLKVGYGQCNTKGILFMALLRALGIRCRSHGFTIYKDLQKGAISGIWYLLSPKEMVHSWVEVNYNDTWYNMEGFILDTKYLTKLQSKFSDCSDNFCGYAVATDDLKNPQINWDENDTYIQKTGIAKDLGIFDNPDQFFEKYSQDLGKFKKMIFRNITRHSMNRNVKRIRNASASI